MDHDQAIENWRRNAESHADRNYQFLRSLKFGSRRNPDQTAAQLHKQAFQIIDCTRCANCCRIMNVILTAEDAERIASHLGMTPADFTETYLERQDGDLVIRQKPCPFLGGDNRCTIYGVRPQCCQEYPHTDKEGISSRTILHAQNTVVCPAVFWIVEEMRKRRK